MEKRIPSQNLERMLARHRQGWGLEQAFYTGPAIFAIEDQFIWKKYWLFAGTIAEIPKPGDFITYNTPGDSVIIIRGNKGEVYAHYNTCRHRGSLICLEESGHAPKLICPYHQWVFDKDGTLLKARLMPDDFDRSDMGLHPVKLEVVEGFIFISFSDNPPAFSKVYSDYAPFLKPFRLDQAKVAFKKRYELNTNWKLIAENFRECYHCGPAHPEYCNAVIGANLRESVDEVLAERKIAWQSKGLAVDMVDFENDSFHFAIRYPLRPGVLSYSLDGKAISLPMGDHHDHDAGVLGLVVYPGFWMDAVSDYMWTMKLTAISPSKTTIDLSWLVNGAAKEGIDYSVERLVEFWKITGEQDWELCENNFSGVASSHYQPGPYSPAELDVMRFIDWYLDRLREGLGVPLNYAPVNT